MLKTKRGFTLIELLIVIVIIGILAVIVAGLVWTNARNKANDASKKAHFHEVQGALEQFMVDKNAYPTVAEGLAILVTDGYLQAVPTSPDAATPYNYAPSGTPPTSYVLWVNLSNQNDTGPGVNNSTNPKRYEVANKQ